MLQKIAPLIILAMFIIGAYFMVKGMHNATQLGKTKPTAKKLKSATPK